MVEVLGEHLFSSGGSVARYIIEIVVAENEISIEVSRNGEFYDETEFHISEAKQAIEYLQKLAREIIENETKKRA